MKPLLADLGRDYRGGQHQALLLLQGLCARGHFPHLLTLRDSVLARRAEDCGVAVHSVSERWRRTGAMKHIRDLISSSEIDLVHANEPHALTAAWLARAHTRVPVVAARRVIFPLKRSAMAQSRYRAAARIIAVSHYVAQQLAACGFAEEKVVVIPDGVTIPAPRSAEARAAARRTLNIPADAPVIGCVAALTPDKGQDLLIRALAKIRVRIPNCQLLLIGQGPCRAALTELAASEKVEPALQFVSTPDDLGPMYEAMDLFAFPAQAEALGSALLLAMAHALPCIALARGGIPEVICDSANGILIPETGVEDWAAAMERVLMNSAEARRLGVAARESIIQRFSADRMVEATLDLYRSVSCES